jgi:hypothetical protein
MSSISHNELLAKLPADELRTSLQQFLEPVADLLPDGRLRPVAELITQGIVTSQSPIVTQIARGAGALDQTIWPTCKRAYRFLSNEHFTHRTLLKGLYHIAQHTVAAQSPAYLVIAVDPVNMEKPYTHDLEGVSIVMKSTPPSLDGEKRLTRGYPAITATIVNLSQPATTYANWFSYTTEDFVSENREIERAIRTTRALFPTAHLRFVADAGLDDQKVFQQIAAVHGEFIIRACHDRAVDVYNDRLHRWERELVMDLTASAPLMASVHACFTHARERREVDVSLGWLSLRLPETQQEIWALIIRDPDLERAIVLLTNMPICCAEDARLVYTEWRHRPRIEHLYRFDQEAGLDIEDMRVQTIERMRRVFVLVLLAALVVYHVANDWPQEAVTWLRYLGGKLGLGTDRDGMYLLLQGIRCVLVTVATLSFVRHHPFPSSSFGYG